MGRVATYAATAIAIAAAIPTGGGSLLAVGLGVSSAAAAAIALGAQLGASLLASKPSGGTGGNQTDWSADPNSPIPIAIGRTGTGGKIVHRIEWGTNNEWQALTTVLSGCGPVDAIERTYADRVLCNFAGKAATAPYAGWLWQDTQVGLTPEPDQLLANGVPPGWTAAHKLSGLAATQLALRYDNKGKGTFTTEPDMLWVLRGVWAWDPRFDSTYPGGDGPQRRDDSSTWVFTKNPPIVGLQWARGWFHNGKRVGGVGQDADTIDIATFVEAANVADANGWRVGGIRWTSDDKWETLKAILQAGAAEPVRHGASLSCIAQMPRIPLAVIGPDDVIGRARLSMAQPTKGLINGIISRCRSEDHFWEETAFDVVRHPGFLAIDGEETTRELPLPLVQVETGQAPYQPAQLAAYEIVNARESGPHELPLKIRWVGYKAGDCLTIGVDEFGELAGKDAIVLRRGIEPTSGAAKLTLRTEDHEKHPWALSQGGGSPPVTEYGRPANPWDVQFGTTGSVEQLLIANSYPIGISIISADAGGSASITVSNHSRAYQDRTVSVAGVTVTGLLNSTAYYLYYDDAARDGVAVTIVATTVYADAFTGAAHPARHYVGAVTTASTGGGDTGGGGGVPPGGGGLQNPNLVEQ